MFSRRYLQSHYFVACIVVITLRGCLSEFPDEDDLRLPLASTFSHQNDTHSSGIFFQGFPTVSSSNEIYNGTGENSATPSLSDVSALPSTSSSAETERPTVTITPSAVSVPSMIITATQVTLGHRMGLPSSSTESNDGGSTEEPSTAATEDIFSTDIPMPDFSPEKLSASNEVSSSSMQTNRKARYQRIHHDLAQNLEVDESVTEPSISSSTGSDFHDTVTDFYKENEAEGGDSYGEFQEDNEIPEQLPTPLALINPNGEGNNPPLEDDFAEAFKKVNANGKRRRFRGGRRGRMKSKKNETSNANANFNPPTTTDPPPPPPQPHNVVDISTSSSNQQEVQQPQEKQTDPDDGSYLPSTPKYKRFRSTTPNPPTMRSTTTTPEPPTDGSPVVRNGPKPMILKNYQHVESNSVTPSPQLEKPSGHTEKISTYFFSTPSPSARLRLRQKIRESYPSSTTSTTTTETPVEDQSSSYPNGDGHEVWKNDFPDFQRNSFFAGPSTNNFKLPAFVPLNLGLEQDNQQEPVENSIARPDQTAALENKLYSVSRHHNHNSDSPTSSSSSYSSSSSSSRGSHDSYSSSSTTPRTRTRHHSFTRNRDYESQSNVTPTPDTEKPIRSDYYAQGSNTESSTFSSGKGSPTGSHYDRTKDKVIFYNDSPYSAQHSPAPPTVMEPPSDPAPGSASQTLSGHFTVSEGPSVYDSSIPTGDSSQSALFTRGKVYSVDDSPSHHETLFKNGPPDSSHIHSPNIVEHSTSASLDSDHSRDHHSQDHHSRDHHSQDHHSHDHHSYDHNSHDHSPRDHHSHDHHYHRGHSPYDEPSIAQHPPGPPLGGSYSHSHIETSHMPMPRPGDSSIYGTVEEVPAHGSSYEHGPPPHHHNHLHHGMHPSSGPIPYPFGSSSQYAPSMSPYPPPPPPSLMSPHDNFNPPPPSILSPNDNFAPPLSSPQPQPPPLPPPPQSYYPHDFAPSYQIQPSETSNNNQPDSHFPVSPNHLAGSPSEIVHGNVSPIDSPPSDDSSSSSVGQIPTDSEPTHQASPDFPLNNLNNDSPPTPDSEQAYNGPQGMDHSFPPHSHTMSTHADYEPANPPLPHDHPFHKNFIPFPTQDLHGAITLANLEQDHPSQDTNAITGGGPYHPGTVENVPTGRPSFQPSPLIPSMPKQPLEFTPIPDDVKDNDIFSSYASKPYDGHPPHGQHESPDHTSHGVPGHEMYDLNNHHHHHHHHHHHNSHPHMHQPDEQHNPYLSSDHAGENQSPFQTPPSPPPGDHGKDGGYAGPVSEIHSGIYHQQNSEHTHEFNTKPPFSSDHSHDGYKIHGDLNGPGDSPLGSHDKPHDMGDGPPGIHGVGPHGLNDGAPGHGGLSSHGPHDIKDGHEHGHSGNDGKKGNKKLQGAFSNTPYVLMFPQLIPEEKMRPSPPSHLSKEIPVIQASSMSDFTSGEKPPLGPGFQAVPVHPRHQMYQVLAKTHYEKMMEKYKESKRKPPSAIYTPYGILVPVGTNVDAASSMQHTVFAKPRVPPKFRGEKSLLSTLLGSSSTTSNRFFPPNGMNGRMTKILEYEPAIDLLAEKLAMKIVNAQQVLGQKSKSEKSEGGKEDKKSTGSRYKDQDHMTMESKVYSTQANPEMKDYLKGVLKGHLTEMVETSVSEEDRRPSTLSSKFINSFFRKGRINLPGSGPGPMPPKQIMSMASPSLPLQSKVPPPPGFQGLQGMQGGGIPPQYPGMGPPFPPPQMSMSMPQGPSGLLGTIRRLFSFGPPERHDIGVGPNFAGRTLYTGNANSSGSAIPYIDGPSPRSSHFPSQMLQNYHMPHSKMMTISPSVPFNMSVVQKNFNSANKQMVLPTSKPSKKKKKSSSSKKTVDSSRSTPSSYFNKSSTNTSNSSTTPKPTLPIKKFSLFSQSKNSNSSSSSNHTSFSKKTISQPSNLMNSPFLVDTSLNGMSSNIRSEPNVKIEMTTKKPEQNKQVLSQINDKPLTIKPLDMFQTLLGSTRSVLNFFKSEARKSSGPTVLIPRSGSFRKRRSLKSLSL